MHCPKYLFLHHSRYLFGCHMRCLFPLDFYANAVHAIAHAKIRLQRHLIFQRARRNFLFERLRNAIRSSYMAGTSHTNGDFYQLVSPLSDILFFTGYIKSTKISIPVSFPRFPAKTCPAVFIFYRFLQILSFFILFSQSFRSLHLPSIKGNLDTFCHVLPGYFSKMKLLYTNPTVSS